MYSGDFSRKRQDKCRGAISERGRFDRMRRDKRMVVPATTDTKVVYPLLLRIIEGEG